MQLDTLGHRREKSAVPKLPISIIAIGLGKDIVTKTIVMRKSSSVRRLKGVVCNL